MKSDKNTADISFEVGFKGDKTRFDLRLISVSEEQELAQKFSDIPDSDEMKMQKEYELCVNALCDFSHNPADAAKLHEKFDMQFNVRNERTIRAAYQQFKYSLSPEINF